MNWLHYLIEANVYLAVFYTVYYLFLSNDTHYTLNRVYLLLSCVVSFIIPVIQLGFLKPAPQAAVIQYINYRGVMVKPIEVTLIPPPEQFTWQDGVFYIYLMGAVILLLVLLFKLYQLIKITRKSNKPRNASYKLVYLNDSNTAFSFFNFLFIGTKAEGRETIIKHELVHISQKHSVDIVFIEVLKIINWFNPFIYIVQHSLKAIHEYIADEKTAATETDALTYSSFLVQNAYGLSGSSITHSFFNYNLLKKRIIMLNQKRSGNLARLKYLLAVPICAGLLCASTLASSKNYGWVDIAPRHTQPTANAIKADLNAKGADANPQAEGYTNKGYKYKLNKYVTGDAINFMVVIYEKDGSKLHYVKSAATPADLKLLNQKYGFIFPPNGKYKLVTSVDTFKFIAPVVKKDSLKIINRKLPPPPPSAVKHITDVRLLPPPPPASPKVVDVKLSLPIIRADSVKHPRLPPPPPINPAFMDLYTDMAKKIHYPAKAFENQITGNVVVKLYLNSDRKISDVKIVQGSNNDFNEEVVRVLKSYPQTITDDTGAHPYYIIGVSFNLVGDKGDIRAPDFGPDVTNTSNYACVIQVNGYIK